MGNPMGGVHLTDEARQDLALEAGRVFTPTAPIHERSLFAGRDRQIRQVVDAVNQRGQHAILFGERGVGKTSLANVLSEFLGTGGSQGILAPRVTCDSQDTFDSVWRKVFEKIELQYQLPVAGFASSSEHRKASAAQLLLPDNAATRITTDIVRRSLTILASENVPIVIVDEFDILAEPTKKVFADAIKALSDDAVDATLLLVGVGDTVGELIKEHKSVERAVVQVNLQRMSAGEISAIVDRGLERLGIAIDPTARQRIVTLSRGLPYYTHLLSLHAARLAIDGAGDLRVTDDIVDTAIQKALDDAHQTTQEAWHLATMSPRKDNLFAVVLLSCALARADELGWFAAQDVRGPLREITGRPYEISNFSQHLSEFCEEKRGHIMRRTGTKRRYRFRFSNPLMQPFAIMQGFKRGHIDKRLLDRIQQLHGG